ncbi:MAG: TerC family protein [Bacteriovorax sp.]|nr:TerC family protein [Bacteriovorax sp.]
MLDFLTHISVAPPWLWIAFTLGILVLLLIDLSLFGRGDHKIQTKTALVESGIWITIALCFNIWFGYYFGSKLGLEFFTGYLIEKSLSIDNLFVILLIFSSFKTPAAYQHRVLFYGVLGAIILRAFFILFGAHLLHTFHWILYIFGFILVVTAIKFLRETDEKIDARENWSIRFLKKILPMTDKTNGSHFFVLENGVRMATPLFLALVVIEATDLVFAVDSIPAVFSITQDAFVAFASNIFAILGLRALYFVLADWVGKLRYLKPGLAAILGFIGMKMLINDFVKISSLASLLVIFSILMTAGLSSWYVARIEDSKKRKEDPFK